MDPATIIAGITAVTGLMEAAKPPAVGDSGSLLLQQFLAQQQARKQEMMNAQPVQVPQAMPPMFQPQQQFMIPNQVTGEVMPIFGNKVIM
jgi:hypothetical protein